MKKIIYIIMAAMIFAACKDPNVGPDDDQNPVDDAGYIQFESPAVGQKSSFLHFYAKGYYESTPTPITYTRDTIHWEITKQIDRTTFEITERLVGDYFGEESINRQLRTITLIKDSDKVLLVTDRTTSSPLLGYKDSIELSLGNTQEVPYFMDWRIGELVNTAAYTGYVSGYKVNDKEYDKLDVYYDFTPTHYDGLGLLFAYNSGYGMVRHYAMNPWLGEANGFDLIRINTTPNSLVGTDWRLKSVVYNDGSVKSIEEIFWGDKNILKDPDFTLFVKSETEVSGFAGCNEYGGMYKLNKENIEFADIFSTKVYCNFTDEYQAILTNSTTYSSDGETLIINSSYNNVKSLVFERVSRIVEEFPLLDTKWKLSAVHYPKGEIIPLERVLGENGSNPSYNEFVLEFMEDNLLSGFSGCNTFGGEYKVESSKIVIKAGNITQMACKFSEDYGKILNNSTKFTADQQRLIIYTELDGYVALEFDRIR